MTLQEKIKQDLAAAMKAKNEEKKETLRVILGEFNRQGNKTLPDEEAIKVMKKLIKSEKEMLEKKGAADHDAFIDIIETYLPKLADEEEIRRWIKEHIDFAEYKNKMQAMRPIMQHFGSAADGETVKRILQSL